MTDRELLEAAAKAAGYVVVCSEAEMHGCTEVSTIYTGVMLEGIQESWSPLADDGDALRLAVKLRLTVRLDDPDAACAGINAHQMGAPTLDGRGPWFRKEWNEGYPHAATRRAIVIAAAEIGKAMP